MLAAGGRRESAQIITIGRLTGQFTGQFTGDVDSDLVRPIRWHQYPLRVSGNVCCWVVAADFWR
jgi:hypothetical protein